MTDRHGSVGRTEDRPNVVLFVMDTTRGLDTVPADPELTPTLASLAEDGTEFTRAFSTAPWTLPSHASLFTGTYPTKHGAHGDHTRLDDELPTLAELFRSAGYETVAVSNNVWITEEFGFTRGFDVFHESNDEAETWGDLDMLKELVMNSLDPESPGDSVLDAIRRMVPESVLSTQDKGAARTLNWVGDWLERREEPEPFFLFLNCIEPHLEYRPPREYARRFLPDGWTYDDAMQLRQDPREYDVGEYDISEEEWDVLRGLYRAEIAYLDDGLDALVDALKSTGEWEDTILLVLSDHGENVGEYGFLGHQYCMYDSLLHVPFVVHGGPFEGGIERSDELVQPVDVPPTLLDVAGIAAPEARSEYQGHSLHPDSDAGPRSAAFAAYMSPRPPIDVLEEKFDDIPDEVYTYQRSLRAVRTDRYKYVTGSDGSEELYDLAADPREQTDISADAPERASALAETIEDWMSSFEHATPSETVSVDPSTEQRLSELGYL